MCLPKHNTVMFLNCHDTRMRGNRTIFISGYMGSNIAHCQDVPLIFNRSRSGRAGEYDMVAFQNERGLATSAPYISKTKTGHKNGMVIFREYIYLA